MTREAEGERRPPAGPVNDSARPLQRAARLLEAMRPTINHDLPNHLVVIQGLLQNLKIDEAEHLTPQGHDYLRRLHSATQNAQNMVSTLRELCRLTGAGGTAEVVPLADLLGEVRAAVNLLYPTQVIEYHFHLEASAVRAPRRALQQTVLQMARVLLTSAGPGVVRLQGAAAAVAAGVALTLRLPRRGGAAAATPTDAALRQRLDVVLARELADCCHGQLTVAAEPEGGVLLTLFVPGA